VTRLRHLVKGAVALVVLVALVAGVPYALWHFIGWPLPHHVPSAGQVGRALNRQGIPSQTLVDALAVVVWLTWATLVASLAVEIPAALSGRHAPHLPVAGIFQPVTGRLVAAVIVACLALAPKPAHFGTPAGASVSTGLMARRPVPALVLRDATLAASTTAVPAAPTTVETLPANGSVTPAPAAPVSTPTTYVVQRGDTLWGIAQKQLGDPLRWSEIDQLNEGRPQPGGATLDDPHWIDPGWTLVLPATAPSTAPATPAQTPPTSAAPTTATSSPPPAPATTPAPTTTTTSPPTTARAATHDNGTVAHRAVSSSHPVRLPSGSEVAASFAAGVLATVAIGRLRRRHAYRYRPPQPGRDLRPVPPRPTLVHLSQASRTDDVNEPPTEPGVAPVFPVDDNQRRLDPGWLEIGTRNGAAVTVEVTDLSGLALTGPIVDDVARALIAGLLVRAVPGATEILLADDTADRLLPGLAGDRSLRRVEDSDQAARVVEAERIARTRRMAGVDAPDASTFRHDNPENPLPLLLVLLDHVPVESHGRWAALLADAARLGIAVVFLGPSPLAASRLTLDATGTAAIVDGDNRAKDLDGVTLYRLRADEAVELLGAVNEANHEADDDFDADDNIYGSVTALHGDAEWPTDESQDTEWPDAPELAGEEDRAIVVDMLGPLRITVHGQTITSGLRGRAQALFAWYLLRPEGATSDEAVDALWPDTDPDQVRRQFWRPFGDLRTRLRSTGDNGLEVLEKTGEHYRPNPAEIACDLWRFQAALGNAARADDDETARAALRRAVETYRGDLLSGVGYSWVEPVRQDLHRRALDAHLRLAELDERAGRPELAVEVLERVIDLDRYAEEPYRRLMALHAAHGRPDAVAATYQLLRRRLADLDVDMDDTTTRQYLSLTTDAPRSVRLSS